MKPVCCILCLSVLIYAVYCVGAWGCDRDADMMRHEYTLYDGCMVQDRQMEYAIHEFQAASL